MFPVVLRLLLIVLVVVVGLVAALRYAKKKEVMGERREEIEREMWAIEGELAAFRNLSTPDSQDLKDYEEKKKQLKKLKEKVKHEA